MLRRPRDVVWSTFLEPDRLTLVSAKGRHLAQFFQEIAYTALRERPGNVLWCDGDHSFNPYDQAELQMTRGHAADDGADRLLVKRCMTPFQWDTVLTRHLDLKLGEGETGLVVVNPFDRLWSHEEIQDWEQEDYTRFSLAHLAKTARRFHVPILLGVDMPRWWKSHPALAQATHDGVDARWVAQPVADRWRATSDAGVILDPSLRRRVTLLDFVPEEPELVVSLPPRRLPKPLAA